MRSALFLILVVFVLIFVYGTVVDFLMLDNCCSLGVAFREIILCMIRSFGKYFSSTRPVYDGKRNMYTREPLPIGREKMEFEVRVTVACAWLSRVFICCFVPGDPTG